MPIIPYTTCPVCDGTTRRPNFTGYKSIAGLDPKTDTLPCNNCGGQTMSMRATGAVRVDPTDPEGRGCKHEYQGRNAGRCYTIYTCRKCGDQYDIDSSD